MATRYGALLACAALVLAPRFVFADDQPGDSAVELTANGTVVLPDGSPAAGAIIYSRDNYDHSLRTATADPSGAFELQAAFLSGVQLHATTPDGRQQTVLRIAEEAVRSAISRPLTVKLEPAKPHLVVVTSKVNRSKGLTSPSPGTWLSKRPLHSTTDSQSSGCQLVSRLLPWWHGIQNMV